MVNLSRRKFCTLLSGTIIGTSGCLSDNIKSVYVTSVTDGDTIDVEFSDGSKDTIRLLGVDTPELGDNTPTEWDGIPDNELGENWLNDWAINATEFMRTKVLDKTIDISFDSISEKRGSYDRLLTYIYTKNNKMSVNRQLISKGYARLYDSQFTKKSKFKKSETKAISNSRGVWNYENEQSTGLTVLEVHEDAKGNDYNNLNDEYIKIQNNRNRTINMSGWTISDEASERYVFPNNYKISSGEDITIYTGEGMTNKNSVYINSDRSIWNNGGDTIYIKNNKGDQILKYSY